MSTLVGRMVLHEGAEFDYVPPTAVAVDLLDMQYDMKCIWDTQPKGRNPHQRAISVSIFMEEYRS